MTKKLTQTQAIKAHCLDCGYDEIATGLGSALDQITDCPSIDCNLYPFRPVNGKEKEKRKQIKIAAMTSEELVKYNAKVEEARVRFKNTMNK